MKRLKTAIVGCGGIAQVHEKALEALVNKAGGNIVGKVAVLAEGDAAERDDIIFLEPLPLFFK